MKDNFSKIKKISNEFIHKYKLFEDSFFSNMPDGLNGRYNECIIMDLLREFLPNSIAVGTGMVIGENNQKSGQIDIILYRKSKEQLKAGDFVIVEKENVIGAIEVKTKKYDKSKALKKVDSNSKLIGKDKISVLFSFEDDRKWKNSIQKKMKERYKKYAQYISSIVFGENIFIKCNSNGKISIFKSDSLSYGYFINSLLEDIGEKVIMNWREIEPWQEF